MGRAISVEVGESPSYQEEVLMRALEQEQAILSGMRMVLNKDDFRDMDSRTIRAATDLARDASQVRIAAIYAALEAEGARIRREQTCG